MFNKHTTALYALVISPIVVASVFAISFVQQQAVAQGNQTGSGGNKTSGAPGSNRASGNATSGGGTGAGSGGNSTNAQ
ncbi:MAG: hypothetical protein ACJ719_14380 [Nitrososphaeraceae archaeon]